jgi:hypothetical protein
MFELKKRTEADRRQYLTGFRAGIAEAARIVEQLLGDDPVRRRRIVSEIRNLRSFLDKDERSVQASLERHMQIGEE